ncbi:glycosyltransferase family A protein, partial [Enterococcus thailandicus]|uniref:glycosyltransferase family A protein n=3 Tax=Enterococcus TaxID=1350 RepID=UPI0022E88250
MNKLFSVIIVYKDTHKYISESIESVINQNFSLDKVEIILVNDKSSDNSKEIADFYQERYPNMIKSVESLGIGISAGKNTGLSYATGKYVNFLDSDDLLQSEVFSSVKNFFEKNSECKLAAIPMVMFENNRDPHMLNKKFTYSRIIDIRDEPQSIQLSTASAFINRDAISENFNESISIGEDTFFLTNLICETGSYGIVADTYYLYRKRIDNSSALQNTYENDEYYTRFFDIVIKGLYKKYRESDYSDYVENVIGYNLQWPLRKQNYPSTIDKEVIDDFYSSALKILMTFKTLEPIKNMKYISYHQKEYLLRLYNEVHGKKYRLLTFENDIILLNGDSKVDSISK